MFSRYYQLSLDGKRPPYFCRMNEEHGILVPNMDEHDEIYLYCVECEYKLFPGLNFYQEMCNLLLAPMSHRVGE